jgi:hypothetical protein
MPSHQAVIIMIFYSKSRISLWIGWSIPDKSLPFCYFHGFYNHFSPLTCFIHPVWAIMAALGSYNSFVSDSDVVAAPSKCQRFWWILHQLLSVSLSFETSTNSDRMFVCPNRPSFAFPDSRNKDLVTHQLETRFIPRLRRPSSPRARTNSWSRRSWTDWETLRYFDEIVTSRLAIVVLTGELTHWAEVLQPFAKVFLHPLFLNLWQANIAGKGITQRAGSCWWFLDKTGIIMRGGWVLTLVRSPRIRFPMTGIFGTSPEYGILTHLLFLAHLMGVFHDWKGEFLDGKTIFLIVDKLSSNTNEGNGCSFLSMGKELAAERFVSNSKSSESRGREILDFAYPENW